ncbi:predicted protein [Uncinocarpus reesii 1704]|uniref:Uncharacterized protein n=1 Tax=Uncinocarpus reesii (strain UAMH 1704) TaxID=336963 RepID=C4JH10_UNCRE|nr:uncharacterized protein UREG_01261 [Uncinocarpus reesii 1704]EEP76412.1 predicted protein [Uncinocarpus reesii 1704]
MDGYFKHGWGQPMNPETNITSTIANLVNKSGCGQARWVGGGKRWSHDSETAMLD